MPAGEYSSARAKPHPIAKEQVAPEQTSSVGTGSVTVDGARTKVRSKLRPCREATNQGVVERCCGLKSALRPPSLRHYIPLRFLFAVADFRAKFTRCKPARRNWWIIYARAGACSCSPARAFPP